MAMNAKRTGTRIPMAAVRWSLAATAIAASAGQAAAQSASDLTKPASTVELGAGVVSDGSYKAGEYNGLQKKGGFLIGDVDIRGGGAYDSDSAMRFRIRGTDLGLASRSLLAEFGVQGRFRVRFGIDELRRNRSDSYETPYMGAGTNVLTLPGSWLVPTVAGSTSSNSAVNTTSARGLVPAIGLAPYLDIRTTSPTLGTLLTPNPSQTALVNAAAGADLPLFQTFDVFTTRTRYDAGISFNAGQLWGFDATFKPERKDGTKLMGTVSRNTGGDISTVIPDRIDTDTSQISLNVTFKRAKSVIQAGYYGSYFKNNVSFMSWQNWATGTPTANTMSSAPSNNFTQFTGSGAFTLSPTTKLTASGAYGRTTQNDTFLTDATTAVVPVSSLNGLVVSTAFNVKLASRPLRKLNLAAVYKFDDRDNRTAVNIFQYGDAGELPSPNGSFPAGATNPLGPVIAQNANANRPYSKRLNQFLADADYALTTGQWIKAGYEFQRINRECPGSWISCADAAVTNEQTVRAEWRATAGSAWTARVGYGYSQRRTPDYNENAFLALVPYANVVPAGQTISALQAMNTYDLTGYVPVAGYNNGVFVNNVFFPSNSALPNALYANNNRVSELVGMRRYYVSDRNRDKIRSAITWVATEAITVQAGLDHNRDRYPGSTYGLQRSRTWTANLDGSYALADNFTADAYYTYEILGTGTAGNTYTANSNSASVNGFTALSGNACDGYTTLLQRNNNNKLDPCLNWFTDMADRVHTVGVGLRGKIRKLDVTANVMSSQASSTNNVTGGNWANNPLALPGAASGTVATFFIPATVLPAVTAHVSEMRLNAKYTVAKAQSIRLLYSYMRTNSADWVYEGMQMGLGTPSGVLPTNEQAFTYAVHVFAVSYVVTF